MAGLVDYNSCSDREESEEETKGGTKHYEAGRKSSWKPKPITCSDKETSSSSRHSNNSKSPKNDGEVKHSKRYKDHKHKKCSRSRSRSRDRNKKSHDSEKKSSSHHRREEKKKKKHKSRSRSRSRGRSRSRDRQPRRTRSQERREKKAETIARMGLDVTSVAAGFVSTGPNLSEGVDKQQAILAAKAAAQVLQNRVQQVQQATGVQLPAFYNPAAVNPVKYAEQIQKRKLLWSGNKDKQQQPTAVVPTAAPTATPGPSSSTVAKLWQSTAFEQDQDGKVTAKFKRLMGIKDPHPEQQQQQDSAAASVVEPVTTEALKKQKQLFQDLDQQYQKAREVTHTQRGLGLGFSSSHPR